jgi:hypothetical protein
MKIWYLYPKKLGHIMNKYPYPKKQAWHVVVVADSPKWARQIAAAASGDAFLDTKEFLCEELTGDDYDVRTFILDDMQFKNPSEVKLENQVASLKARIKLLETEVKAYGQR